MDINQVQGEDTTSRESLELLYQISRELSSDLDFRTVLNRVLLRSMARVGAVNGSIVVLDKNGKPVNSAIITGEQILDNTTNRLQGTLEHGLAGWVVRNRQAALITDTSLDERWIQRNYPQELTQAPKSAVSAPLITHDKVVGVLTLVHPQPGFFSQSHLALVQGIADQASIAVLNARLYAESQRQARVMTALANSAAGILISLKLDYVLTGIMQQSSQVLDVKTILLALIDPMDGRLVYKAAFGELIDKILESRVMVGEGIPGWVILHGQSLILQNPERDPRYSPIQTPYTKLEVKSIACAPIRYQGEVIGVLEAINPKSGFFDPDTLLLLTGIGSLAGTAIRHAQLYEQLQAALQSYRDLFEDSIDPILITNWNGVILAANRKALSVTEYTQETLHGMQINTLHTLVEEKIGPGFARLRSGDTATYQSILRTCSGHELPVEVYVHPVFTNNVSRLQWIFRDITERKNLDALRKDLTAMIYHDLRSPLGNVISSLDILDSILPEGKDQTIKSLIDIALRSTQRIQRLTDSLLDMNRLEAGKSVGNQQMVGISVLIQDAVDVIMPMLLNKEQNLSLEISESLSEVYIDPDMIRRVIVNILENASKFTQIGGHIQVGAKQEGAVLTTWIRDDGIGIPVSDQKRIFEKYYQAKQGDAPRGLGLGLAYCRLVVQVYGGQIWVESEPGKGSCFIFTLPVEKAN